MGPLPLPTRMAGRDWAGLGPATAIDASRPPRHVQYAGIADEFLRSRIDADGELSFFQWESSDARSCARDRSTAAERFMWRLPVHAATAARRTANRPTDDHRSFLMRRRNDPTSYFGSRTAMHLC